MTDIGVLKVIYNLNQISYFFKDVFKDKSGNTRLLHVEERHICFKPDW